MPSVASMLVPVGFQSTPSVRSISSSEAYGGMTCATPQSKSVTSERRSGSPLAAACTASVSGRYEPSGLSPSAQPVAVAITTSAATLTRAMRSP